jgi:hypothetical protein
VTAAVEAAGPILIAGADRSGTSLMYALLASHPNISMVRRTNMWRWFHGHYGDLRDPANVRRCLDDLCRYPRVAKLDPDIERLTRDFAAGAPTYGRLFSLIHEHHAGRAGKARWADKSLHTEHEVATILAELPHARVIQMVRDPRDRHASIVKRYDDRTKSISATTGRWLRSSTAILHNQARFPDNVMTIRYEMLAAEPARTMLSVCAFLDEPFTPRMLSMQGAPDHGGTGGNSSFAAFEPGTISTRSIGRFREVLSPTELAAIQAMTGRRMRQLGYEPVPVPWSSVGERGRFYATSLPVALSNLTAWVALDHLRARRPVPAGRLVATA